MQYTTQPAHDSESEGSEFEDGYSDEDWLEDDVRTLLPAPKAVLLQGKQKGTRA